MGLLAEYGLPSFNPNPNRIKESGGIENKFFCVGVGAMILEEHSGERLKLITFSKGPLRMDPNIGKGGQHAIYWRTDRN
jgi:hypothetical protein